MFYNTDTWSKSIIGVIERSLPVSDKRISLTESCPKVIDVLVRKSSGNGPTVRPSSWTTDRGDSTTWNTVTTHIRQLCEQISIVSCHRHQFFTNIDQGKYTLEFYDH